MGLGTPAPVTADPCVVVGELAALLAGDAPLAEALGALVTGLQLRSVVLRSTHGDLLAVGGSSVRSLPVVRSVKEHDGALEFAVRAQGVHVAVLSVEGARPSQVSALRTAAAVLGLSLRPRTSSDVDPADLLDDRELDRTAVADALHDGPVQTLMAARYAADSVARGGDPGVVRDAIQHVVVELRRQIWQLRPRGQAGLVAALSQLSERLVETGRPPLLVSVVDGDVTGSGAETAYRLVQELALGQDGQLLVAISHQGAAAVVEVTGAAALPGLAAWTRRAAALGGSLTPVPGRFTLHLPQGQSTPLNTQDHARNSS